jgi:4-hydroxy-tetrahydrodipicolinate synthase
MPSADVARIVVDQAAGRVPVFVGTAAESTDDAIRYSRRPRSWVPTG